MNLPDKLEEIFKELYEKEGEVSPRYWFFEGANKIIALQNEELIAKLKEKT